MAVGVALFQCSDGSIGDISGEWYFSPAEGWGHSLSQVMLGSGQQAAHALCHLSPLSPTCPHSSRDPKTSRLLPRAHLLAWHVLATIRPHPTLGQGSSRC